MSPFIRLVFKSELIVVISFHKLYANARCTNQTQRRGYYKATSAETPVVTAIKQEMHSFVEKSNPMKPLLLKFALRKIKKSFFTDTHQKWAEKRDWDPSTQTKLYILLALRTFSVSSSSDLGGNVREMFMLKIVLCGLLLFRCAISNVFFYFVFIPCPEM